MKTTKKIAIATAAALAMFGISAVANAAPLTVTVNSVANATTSAAPATVAVPATNVIDAGHTIAIAATADTGTAVTFAATGVKLVSALNTADAPKTVANFVELAAGMREWVNPNTGTKLPSCPCITIVGVWYVVSKYMLGVNFGYKPNLVGVSGT